MKVSDLISRLQTLDPDMIVYPTVLHTRFLSDDEVAAVTRPNGKLSLGQECCKATGRPVMTVDILKGLDFIK